MVSEVTMRQDVDLPRSVRQVIAEGIRAAAPRRVLLYGSRARGTHHPRSDFDFAFERVADSRGWREFYLDQTYEPLCVFPIDLVVLEEAPPELVAEIMRDGIEVYRDDA